MTVQSDLVTGARLLTENAAMRDRLDVALLAAQEAAHATETYRSRLRAADNYLATVAGIPEHVRTDLRALLVGGMS
jgi:uncharacterized protein HemY